ncbi:MAG TPA: X2-like carbohydrate binding domain-containing protein, partial [Clostridia bacterium]
MKKFLSLFVVMLLVLNFIPLASFAAETQAVSPNEVHIDKDALKDVTVTISGTLSSIMNGTGTLSSVYDYSVSGNSVTIKKNYLN